MFTGIIEEAGTIASIVPGDKSVQLTVYASRCVSGTGVGDSIAVNGCCLTVTKLSSEGSAKLQRLQSGDEPSSYSKQAAATPKQESATLRPAHSHKKRLLHFDLLQETWQRTNLQFGRVGSLVNLERSLRVGDRLGGHFVTGHIEGLGEITRWERQGTDHVLDIAAAPEILRYVIFKGSIAVDGISLTVAELRKTSFRVWIIPHTYEVTALHQRKVGDAVNLETDLLGKYVEKFVTSARAV
jgi:riboflavin synthase